VQFRDVETPTRMTTDLNAELIPDLNTDIGDIEIGHSKLTPREKRDLQKSQLRPLANRRPELYDEDEYSSAEYEQMMEMYNGTLASIDEGEIVKSRVLEIRENMVVLDIGFKSEGTIPLEEFKDMPDLKPGDEVEVLLEHLEDQEGSVVLSKKKADFMRVWEKIRVAYETDSRWKGRSSRRSRVAWSSTSWASTPSSRVRRSRSVASRTSTSCSARSTSSRSSSSTSAAATSSSRAV
jgi:hypothetical protein